MHLMKQTKQLKIKNSKLYWCFDYIKDISMLERRKVNSQQFKQFIEYEQKLVS